MSGCVYKWNDIGRSENRWRRDAEFEIGRDAQGALKYCSYLRWDDSFDAWPVSKHDLLSRVDIWTVFKYEGKQPQ